MKLHSIYSFIIGLGTMGALSSCQDQGGAATDSGAETSAEAAADAGEDSGGSADAPIAAAGGGDREWPTWGRDGSRNMVGNAANLPVEVNPGEMDDETEEIDLTGAKNIRWVAKLGSQSYGTTSVAFGKVFAGTNNESPRDKRNVVDRGNLMCFDEKTGEFLWQLVSP